MNTLKTDLPNPKVLASLELDPAFPYAKAEGIRLLAFDVDGILTDGGLYYDASGLCMKRFDVQDGVAFKLAQNVGIITALITGMESSAAEKRAEALGIEEFYSGIFDKVATMEEIRKKHSLDWSEIAYTGDDWLDMPLLRRVGLSMTVADAQPEVRGMVDYVSPLGGGRGAVRQLVRHVLVAQGKLEEQLGHWASR
ncbi:HAD hydrolase family protein [Desulfovibrio sp. OttesenSCG-928-C06]|nr:HAD hydrolase family protein [Desulfovibrio sp. OttesenSCG-928-C06]